MWPDGQEIIVVNSPRPRDWSHLATEDLCSLCESIDGPEGGFYEEVPLGGILSQFTHPHPHASKCIRACLT